MEKKVAGKRMTWIGPWEAQGKGVIIGLLSMMFVLTACAGFIAGGVIPEKGMSICVLVAAGVGGAATAFSAARMRGMGSGVTGMLGGLLTASVCLVSGFILYRNVDVLRCMSVGIVMIVVGGVCGYAGTGKKRRRR